MKKRNVLALAYGLAIFTSLSSCQDGENLSVSNPDIIETSFINEGYYLPTTDNVVHGTYDGRHVDLVEVGNGQYLYDGDVLLDRGDFSMEGEPATEGTYAGRTWPNRTVRWRYASGVSQSLRDKWTAATQAWRDNLGFTFTQITSNTGDYILVQQNSDRSAFSTSIGRRGGQQIISLDPSVFSTGTMIHEIGHAVGLHHEQKRPDRNNFIIINYSNIRPNWKSQYDPCSGCTATGTFDFSSIMLYGATASSTVVFNTSIPAMTRLDGTTWTANRSFLSTGDLDAINTMY